MNRLCFFLLFTFALAACGRGQAGTANPVLQSADQKFFLTSDDVLQQAQQSIQNPQLTLLTITYPEDGNILFWYGFTGDDQDFTAT